MPFLPFLHYQPVQWKMGPKPTPGPAFLQARGSTDYFLLKHAMMDIVGGYQDVMYLIYLSKDMCIYVYIFTAYLNTVIQCHPKLRMDDPFFFTCFTQARRRGLQCCHQHPRPRCIPSVAICSWSKNRRFTPTKNGEPATILLAGLQWQRSLQMLKYMEARSFGGPAEGEI